MQSTFSKMRQAVQRAKNVDPFRGHLLALDPGETTGMCIFDGDTDELVYQAQLKTWPLEDCVKQMTNVFNSYPAIKHVVHEMYAVYDWKTTDHSWSQIPTVQIIGSIITLCIQRGIPYSSQTAQVAKNFCTDHKLESWGFYSKGQRHARDSVRHGAYYLLFRPT